jgi:hypothetical protein
MILTINSVNRFVFVTETQWVFCEVGSERIRIEDGGRTQNVLQTIHPDKNLDG